jgi:hypothetical protein
MDMEEKDEGCVNVKKSAILRMEESESRWRRPDTTWSDMEGAEE